MTLKNADFVCALLLIAVVVGLILFDKKGSGRG